MTNGPTFWLILALGLLGGGKMIFEGARAFAADPVERESAQQVQQLGAWARVFVEMGVRPRSSAVSAFFLGYGALWVASAVAHLLGLSWARWALVAAAVGSLWYLGLGTLISLALLALLAFAAR